MARAMRELVRVNPRFKMLEFIYTGRSVSIGLERGYYRLKMAAGGGGGAYYKNTTQEGSTAKGSFSVASGGAGASIDCIIYASSRGYASLFVGSGGAGYDGSTPVEKSRNGGDSSFSFEGTIIVLEGGGYGSAYADSKGVGGKPGDATTIKGVFRQINPTCKGEWGAADFKTEIEELFPLSVAGGGPASGNEPGLGGGAMLYNTPQPDWRVRGVAEDGYDGYASIKYLGKKEPFI